MITSIKITDNQRTPFHYLPNIPAFKNGSEFLFRPGVNVIIGENGSGKSTLLDLIAKYTLCEKNMCSRMPDSALAFPNIFDDDRVLDGIEIHADYISKVFHFLPHTEMMQDSILDCIENFGMYGAGLSCSSGEKGIVSINSFFQFMFSQDDYAFPIKRLKEIGEESNPFWADRIKNLVAYYANNRVEITEDDFEYTVLMDEPDRNLDIENIMQVYGVLSFHKPQTQIIAVVHNPALIYKLSKLDCVHFVEMTEGYLKKVKTFAE